MDEMPDSPHELLMKLDEATARRLGKAVGNVYLGFVEAIESYRPPEKLMEDKFAFLFATLIKKSTEEQ